MVFNELLLQQREREGVEHVTSPIEISRGVALSPMATGQSPSEEGGGVGGGGGWEVIWLSERFCFLANTQEVRVEGEKHIITSVQRNDDLPQCLPGSLSVNTSEGGDCSLLLSLSFHILKGRRSAHTEACACSLSLSIPQFSLALT